MIWERQKKISAINKAFDWDSKYQHIMQYTALHFTWDEPVKLKLLYTNKSDLIGWQSDECIDFVYELITT